MFESKLFLVIYWSLGAALEPTDFTAAAGGGLLGAGCWSPLQGGPSGALLTAVCCYEFCRLNDVFPSDKGLL